ncbi:SpaA isopeptide-forming pilin-related protein [Lactiplantibacillus plantarum]|uniref:SpaA isopeptide-forming pilin-related protein n=1 Tax=Lactiplantibacillus plantarum TaxID=1590 RepID=UPI001BA8AF8C|nr:SpaA isopeptide-forming pilin-related protein [Lactiplantibacillus plantarum]MBS0936363.1 LPXTG cell wall anchor domain-containing protein [Lactiplantibacillus plantarum]MBS0943792.1 LPXTG cell wall anchor domain-containing protein [Lactiplantibacillus plantarum]
MKRRNKLRLVTLTVASAIGLGVGLTYMGKVSLVASADDVPQTVDVKNTPTQDKDFSYSFGYRTAGSSGKGVHFVDGIKDTDGNYLFCVQWSKGAPSNVRIAAKVQATPAVTWLVNNYYKGASKRFETLGKGEEGDYWLYQSVIHWLTEPEDKDGLGNYNIQHFFGKTGLDAEVEKKLKALKEEAERQAKSGTTDEVLNTHAMSFSPTKLELSGSDLSNGNYSKSFTFKSTSMKNVKVWLDGQTAGTKLSGGDLNNVANNTEINLTMPYKDVATEQKTFHVKAKGDWNKQIKVAYIYGDSENVNQNVAKQVTKATTVPLDVTANMDVTVSPATGKITFTKKGGANNNSQILAGTKFQLTANGVDKTATADSSGNVIFDALPLGQDYTIKEIVQPNKYYDGDLSSYTTKVTALNGSNPSTSAEAFGGTLINKPTHHDINVKKLNAQTKTVAGAEFVVVQVDKGAGLKVSSATDAKAKAMYSDGTYIVAGNNNGKPAIVTSDESGNANFKLVATNTSKYDYYAVEVKAPAGYQLALDSYKLNVSDTGANGQSFNVKDDLKPKMPETGSQESLYYFVGTVLVIGAAGAYVMRKKMLKK